MSNTTESKDFTIKTDEGVAINTELDTQTILLQTLADNTRELNKIKELIKETNKILNKIYQ